MKKNKLKIVLVWGILNGFKSSYASCKIEKNACPERSGYEKFFNIPSLMCCGGGKKYCCTIAKEKKNNSEIEFFSGCCKYNCEYTNVNPCTIYNDDTGELEPYDKNKKKNS